MKTGYTEDWFGQSTQEVIIVAETTDGRYVCQFPPIPVTRLDGSTYEASSMAGLFLRYKKDIKRRKEE